MTETASSKVDPIHHVLASTSREQTSRDTTSFISPGAYRIGPIQVPTTNSAQTLPGESSDVNTHQEVACPHQSIDQPEVIDGILVDQIAAKKFSHVWKHILFTVSIITLSAVFIYMLARSNSTSSALSSCPDVKKIIVPIVGEESLNDISSLRYQCYRIICDEQLIDNHGEDMDHDVINIYLFLLSLFSIITSADLPQMQTNREKPQLCELIICNSNESIAVLPIRNFASTSNGGTIPSEIGLLSDMVVIDFQNNNLVGTIPTELGMMKELRILDLQNNYLTGPIPSEIFQIKTLELLLLDRNNLEGTIPTAVMNSSSLKYLGLSNNSLSGSIPTGLEEIPSLMGLDIHGNNLLGSAQFLCTHNFPNESYHFEESFGLHFLNEYVYVKDFTTGIIGCDNGEEMHSCDCCTCVIQEN